MKHLNINNMKTKLIALFAIAFMTASCDYGLTKSYDDNIPLGNRALESIKFEDCEYIYLRRLGSVAITHKGNCKNPDHAYK